MILCDKCNISHICRIADKLKEYEGIIELSSCIHFAQKDKAVEQKPHLRDVFSDATEISKKIHEITDKADEGIIPASEHNSCSSCGKSNVELLVCTKCGNYVCSDCATETINGKVYCEKCYEDSEPLSI